ncbi:putative cytochrome P450 monooxygenase [Apodospora peruviana]|uniref:Cytochrome P450 monooxygenase n=1 Tax=Apodospora peruviana TaxID=516989 RepID=A0AAE0IKV4_9PEZI|nr:putative cytochrome P450 monooxygenase [Apodospora peruviana]
MASSHGSSLWADLPDPSAKPIPYLVVAFLATLLMYTVQSSSKTYMRSLPHLNPKEPLALTNLGPKKQFYFNCWDLLAGWYGRNPDKPARMITSDVGELMLLPPQVTNEVRNNPHLSFSKYIYTAFHAHLPGFEGFREGSRDSHIVQAVIMKDLTKYLNKVTEPLAEETALATPELFPVGENNEWQSVPLRETLLRLVARISSRVFLGEELCRNEEWLKVTREYTVDSFKAAEYLRFFPTWTRPFVHWFLPSCRVARGHVATARRVIAPVLQKRREQKNSNEKVEFDDAMEWFEKEAKGQEYDPAISQLVLSMAAIHTTTDLVSQVLTDLCKHPEIVEPLRKEIVACLEDGGWKKTSLYNMKLLDSVIKETQRVKPVSMVSLRRIATQDVKLSNGSTIPKGAATAVMAHRMWDASVYENPDQWDGYRFLRMREEPGRENMAHLVSTSADHMGFGHGAHACPGRFFAANETKLALVYLLLKYDWRLPEGVTPKIRKFGFSLGTDPTMKMEYRGREPEIEI